MFPHSRIDRIERLRGKANFALFAKAKQYRGRLIRVACVKQGASNEAEISDSRTRNIKAAFVVSKKTVPKAVHRNKLKRRLRELYKKHHDNLPDNVWLMIIALPDAVKADFASLEADLNALFTKISSENARHLRH